MPDQNGVLLEPIVHYPRQLERGKRYLVTVDFRWDVRQQDWPYGDDEEHVLHCILNGGPWLRCRILEDSAVVVHRFGGTYGPARFLLMVNENTPLTVEAPSKIKQPALSLTLRSAAGHPLHTFSLGTIEIVRTGSGSEEKIPVPEWKPRPAAAAAIAATEQPSALAPVDDWRTHILWVDDRPRNNDYERRNFERHGLRFTLAVSSDDAFERLSTTSFVAIISDMGRPDGPRAGYKFLDRLRGQGDQTPFFFYAGSKSAKHKRETQEHGGQGCTNDFQELFKMVMKVVSEASLQRSSDELKAEPNTRPGLRIRVVGSYAATSSARRFDQFCENLGKEIGARDHTLVISATSQADGAVLKGFVSVEPRGRVIFVQQATPLNAPLGRSLHVTDLVSDDPHVTGTLDAADAVIAIGGAKHTALSCQAAIERRMPAVAISEFGGSAAKFQSRILRMFQQSEVYSDQLRRFPNENLPSSVLDFLESWHGSLNSDLIADRAKAVCRVESSAGSSMATGFLLAPGLFVTAHHNMRDEQQASNSRVMLENQILELAPNVLFVTYADLDVTLVAVSSAGDRSIQLHNALSLQSRQLPGIGERVTIISFAPDSHNAGEPVPIMSTGTVTGIDRETICEYSAETDLGSSGAPVFNANGELIAVHHSKRLSKEGARTVKRGTLISAIADTVMNMGTPPSDLLAAAFGRVSPFDPARESDDTGGAAVPTTIRFRSYSRLRVESRKGSKAKRDMFDWCVFVDEPAQTLLQIESVEYVLHRTLHDPVRRTSNVTNRFALYSSGWGSFAIQITIWLRNRQQIHTEFYLQLAADDWPRPERLTKFTNPRVKLVYENLFKGSDRWRRLDALTRDTHIPENEIREILADLEEGNHIRRSPFSYRDHIERWRPTALIGAAPRIDPISETDLTLVHSCWRYSKKDAEFGRPMYAFHVVVRADDHILDRIDFVRYTLSETYPDPVREIRDRKSCFVLKELAWGRSTVQAEIKIREQSRLVKLKCEIMLTESGPRI